MITKSEQYHVEVGDQGIVYYILPSIVKKRYLLKLAINSRCLECRCWLLHNWSQEGEEEGMREEEEVDITKLELHHTDWRIVRIEERGSLNGRESSIVRGAHLLLSLCFFKAIWLPIFILQITQVRLLCNLLVCCMNCLLVKNPLLHRVKN